MPDEVPAVVAIPVAKTQTWDLGPIYESQEGSIGLPPPGKGDDGSAVTSSRQRLGKCGRIGAAGGVRSYSRPNRGPFA